MTEATEHARARRTGRVEDVHGAVRVEDRRVHGEGVWQRRGVAAGEAVERGIVEVQHGCAVAGARDDHLRERQVGSRDAQAAVAAALHDRSGQQRLAVGGRAGRPEPDTDFLVEGDEQGYLGAFVARRERRLEARQFALGGRRRMETVQGAHRDAQVVVELFADVDVAAAEHEVGLEEPGDVDLRARALEGRSNGAELHGRVADAGSVEAVERVLRAVE